MVLAGASAAATRLKSRPRIPPLRRQPRIEIVVTGEQVTYGVQVNQHRDQDRHRHPERSAGADHRHDRADRATSSCARSAICCCYVPGASYGAGEGNRDQIVLRGNSSTADFFVDGVRDDVQYFRDFYNIDRVEVLKGPNAMIFGRGGGGGIVNRVLKRPTFRRPRSARPRPTIGATSRLTGDLDQPLASAVGVRLNGDATRTATASA